MKTLFDLFDLSSPDEELDCVGQLYHEAMFQQVLVDRNVHIFCRKIKYQ